MTAPVPAPGTLLDRLEEARNSIGDSPAFRVVGFDQGTDEPEWVYARFDDGGQSLFAECYGTDAAELIAATLQALPELIRLARDGLALRDAVLGLAEELDEQQEYVGRLTIADRLRAVAADATGEA